MTTNTTKRNILESQSSTTTTPPLTNQNGSGGRIDTNYRLDNSIRKELFVNYWRNRLSRFDLNLIEESNIHLPPGAGGNHHLSNRDIGK
jgi:hypothetical protein